MAVTIDGTNGVSGPINVTTDSVKLDGNYPVASNNVALGNQALDASLTGNNNTAIGNQALTANTSGAQNQALGSFALGSNTTGSNNEAIGYSALYANTTGGSNVAIGREALTANTTASNNTAVGYYALKANTTGIRNTAVGTSSADALTTGINTTAVGEQAGTAITTGNNNAVFGQGAGLAITTPDSNTFIGTGAGSTVTTGSKNTILGRYNGNQGGLDIRTASSNTVLSDGDGNPRLFIDGGGVVNIGKFDSNIATNGHMFEPNGIAAFTRSADLPLCVNRNTDDGVLVLFRQDNTNEGTISVSGTTVSYNGGHLSRWSQLADNTRDESVVKGTVMSNLDQMAEWTTDGVTEDNEQLNCMKVSDVEGDANVAGVFVNWDDDDDVYTNDMNVAMTGDMVIRIASGTTVARGDLLMSAGDGTAKPQGDDIVRSKTIAKVTSTYVSHTYDDGSYLVPCVLMAC